MPGISGVEWLNQNSLRAYPLHDEATRRDVSSDFTLPDDLIVDLTLSISFSSPQNPARYHLSEVAVFGHGIVLTISYTDDLDVTTTVGSVSVSAAAHTLNQSYFFYGVGPDFADVVGVITIGNLATTLALGGAYAFDLTGGRLVPSVVRPDVRSVTHLYTTNGDDTSDPIYGAVNLVSGANVVLDLDTDSSYNVITISVVPGENLQAECDCVVGGLDDRSLPPCIRTVNGVPPTEAGNLTIAGGDCLNITPHTAALRFEDSCAQPCCTAQELQILVTSINDLMTEIRTDHFLLSRLENKLGSLDSIVRTIAATGFLFG